MADKARRNACSALFKRFCTTVVVPEDGCSLQNCRRGCWLLMSSYACATSLMANSWSGTQSMWCGYTSPSKLSEAGFQTSEIREAAGVSNACADMPIYMDSWDKMMQVSALILYITSLLMVEIYWDHEDACKLYEDFCCCYVRRFQ
jgi:hypothetical protein